MEVEEHECQAALRLEEGRDAVKAGEVVGGGETHGGGNKVGTGILIEDGGDYGGQHQGWR